MTLVFSFCFSRIWHNCMDVVAGAKVGVNYYGVGLGFGYSCTKCMFFAGVTRNVYDIDTTTCPSFIILVSESLLTFAFYQ